MTLLLPLSFLALTAADTSRPRLPDADRTRLIEAVRLADQHRARAWPGWEQTPMALLLVIDSVEFLIHHPSPPGDFRQVAIDQVLGRILTRPRQLPPNLLATFAAFGGVPTIIIGQPARTARASAAWTVTALHENFHQLQYGAPGYQDGVRNLDLSGGDETGMWMLDYPLPYDSVPVIERADALKQSLLAFVNRSGEAASHLAPICADMQALQATLSPRDWRYLQFQLWQEGVARYVELKVAERAAAGSDPAQAFRALPDWEPYRVTSDRLRRQLRAELATSFKDQQRVSFYSMGAALALLLDDTRPEWKRQYLDSGYRLNPCT